MRNFVRVMPARFAAFLFCLASLPALGQQAYPEKLISIVLGYNAGTGADIIARNLATKLAAITGKPVIVENRPGALTNIGAEYVSKSKPDGYTLFFTAGNSTFAANAQLFKTLPFDPVKSFIPVNSIGRVPFVLVVPVSSPAQTVGELTKLLKDKKDKGSYGSATPFNTAISELYKSTAGLQTTQIAYKGINQAIPELLSGALDFMISDAGTASPHMKANRVRALAVTTAQRSPSMPELPTMVESGVAGFDLSAWLAVYAPAQTPRPIVEKLADWINQAMATDEMKQVLANFRYDAMPNTPDKLAAFHASEMERWGVLMRAAKVEPQ